MNSVIQNLKERGFFAQCTNENALSLLMQNEPVTFYIGVDPTAASVHIGHMVPFFAFRHLREAGQKGIALLGGGTARIGDPSGRDETRKILSYDDLDKNADSIKAQLDKFVGFDEKTAWTVNNKDWLADLNYIDFLRDIGRHFSVNRMLSFEAYKMRLETGLSFVEFNYQLLQSYDFLELYRRYNCRLQIGGDDQWGNIVAGAELVRRVEGTEVYGLTFPLVTTADGNKMGKSLKGALFLDPELTSPYEFFQYWRNIQDADIKRFFLMFTFLSLEEIENICTRATNPNEAKERLAWELTAIIHGKEEADRAMSGARAAFGHGEGGDKSAMPKVKLNRALFEAGYNIVDLFLDAGLVTTKSEARRLIEQGGAFYINDSRETLILNDINGMLGSDKLNSDGEIILRAGKKRYCLVITG